MQQIKKDLENLKLFFQRPSTGDYRPIYSRLHFIFLTISVFILVIGVTFQLKTQTRPITAASATKTVPTNSAWNNMVASGIVNKLQS